jgi:HD superfamily phosphohydrolase YqeK
MKEKSYLCDAKPTIHTKNISPMRKVEYCKELLRKTQRPNIERLIKFITQLGYFIAPGSMKHHCYKGGLVSHSLETYHKAMNLRSRKIAKGVDPNLLPVESVIIASLMHDLCKADELRFDVYRRRVYSIISKYEGHSQKSVTQLAKAGFVLTDEEKSAILWHMGGKRFKEDRRTFFSMHPLAEIIFYADKYSIKNRHKKSDVYFF